MKKIIFAVASVLMVAVIAVCIFIQERELMNSVYFTVRADGEATQSVNLYHKNDQYYVFLPSYASLDTVSVSHKTGCSFYLDGKYYNADSSLEEITLDRVYQAEIKNSLGFTVCSADIIFMKAEKLPTLSLTLVDGTLDDVHKDKEKNLTGYATMIEPNSTVNYMGQFGQFHGRGNSSWDQKKKPYALEFDQETELLNMGKHQKYTLIANAMDESGLRNKLVYDAAEAIGLQNHVKSEYVDLYVNGDYVGLYLLTNKVSIFENNPDVVDLEANTQSMNQYPLNSYETFEKYVNGIYIKGYSIDSNPADITGSYLIEFELDDRVKNESNLFITRMGQNITVKVPAYASEAQMDYISGYIQNMEDKLGTDEILNIIDEDSWEKYYLIQETFANISRTSYFFYKNPDAEGVQLISGPIWDFDLSMGTHYDNENTSPYQLHCNWGWFEKYNSNETCMNGIKEEYANVVRPIMQEVIRNWIDKYQSLIEKSYLMNEVRWEGIQYNWWVNHYDTQQGHSDYLKQYLTERLKYLDYLWLGAEKPQEVMENEAVRPAVSAPAPVAPPTLPQRALAMLSNEQNYVKYGIVLFGGVSLVCIAIDARKSLKARRKSDG